MWATSSIGKCSPPLFLLFPFPTRSLDPFASTLFYLSMLGCVFSGRAFGGERRSVS